MLLQLIEYSCNPRNLELDREKCRYAEATVRARTELLSAISVDSPHTVIYLLFNNLVLPLLIAVLLPMDVNLTVAVAVLGVLVIALIAVMRNNHNTPGQGAELIGRLTQLAESNAAQQAQFSERLQVQERTLSKTLEERLADLSRRIGENLQQSSNKTGETMTKLQERLAVIDAAQKNITKLSSEVVGLQDILSNKLDFQIPLDHYRAFYSIDFDHL